ncbi:MAG: heme exporter protein CcmB [Wolbachia endosymbiont of Tyrophagus putrescentiae]|nr:heme exporter protein CcmB [Wolbachia endosymbiont of Tyrophagus putrescentiae]
MFNLLIRKVTDFTHTIFLFMIMLSLSLFALDNHYEQEVVLTIIWICTAFTLQISTSYLFASDYHDGVLEQIFIQPRSSRLAVFYKIFFHWLLLGIPISAIACIFSITVLDYNIKYVITMGLSLLFNILIIINISATGHSLMLGKSNLAATTSQILILPMLMPTFVYFKLLTSTELNINILLITALIFITLIANSLLATHTALKFAIEQD